MKIKLHLTQEERDERLQQIDRRLERMEGLLITMYTCGVNGPMNSKDTVEFIAKYFQQKSVRDLYE